jgi:ABC-type transporter Mla subunit MlaD
MPSLLSGISAALQAAHSSVTAAAAAAGGSNQASVASLVDNTQEAVNQARQKLDAATATLNTANQQVGY